MRLGKRERAALKALKAQEAKEHEERCARIAKVTGVAIQTSMVNLWPMGKASVRWGYNGGTAGRIHRAKR